MLDAFVQVLHELGYAEGRNLILERRYAEWQPQRLRELAAELAGAGMDVIVAFATPAALAAKQATSVIPIVAVAVGDPVAELDRKQKIELRRVAAHKQIDCLERQGRALGCDRTVGLALTRFISRLRQRNKICRTFDGVHSVGAVGQTRGIPPDALRNSLGLLDRESHAATIARAIARRRQ